MIRRVGIALRAELTKALRSKFTYVGPFLVFVVVLCLPGIRPIERDGQCDYEFIGMATSMALNLLGLLLVLMYCASLVSSELSSGTICMVLVRPILRSDFLFAKLLLGLLYAAVVCTVAAAASWGVVLARGNLNGVSYGGELLHTNREMAQAYVLAMALGFLPLCAAVSYAVMISTFTRNTGAAVGSAVGIWVAIDTLKYPLHIAPVAFSTYMERPWQAFADMGRGLDPHWLPDAWYCALVSLVSTVVFTATAAVILRRKDLHL